MRRQALLESPPLLPHQLFRRQLALAVAAAEEDASATSARAMGLSAWYPSAGGDGGALPRGGESEGQRGDEYDLDLGDGDDDLAGFALGGREADDATAEEMGAV